jgi:uncharacterized metal-binding protein
MGHSGFVAVGLIGGMVRLSTIGFLLGIVLFFVPVPPFAMIASIIVLLVSVVLRLLGR